MTSAYPTHVDKLTAQVRDLADELGSLPSANQVMKRFRVGRPKASAALANLNNTRTAETAPETGPDAVPDGTPDASAARRLRSVPALDSDPVTVADEVSGSVAETAPAAPAPAPAVPVGDEPSREVSTVVDAPAPTPAGDTAGRGRWARPVRDRVRSWPLLLIALGAFVAIWGGWVDMGRMTGFGEITLLPGIADGWTVDSAITLPLGMEAYAAFAMNVWLSDHTRSARARGFAKWSALGALVLGSAGQVAVHLMKAAGLTVAPWQITTVVSCLPVIVLGFGAALVHLMRNTDTDTKEVR